MERGSWKWDEKIDKLVAMDKVDEAEELRKKHESLVKEAARVEKLPGQYL